MRWWVLAALLALSSTGMAQEDADIAPPAPDDAAASTSKNSPFSGPVAQPAGGKEPGVQWKPLFAQSFRFLMFEHAYRYATEEGTRHPGRPFFQGYLDAVGSLHGWADGDPFYVNYVGHPMQGAVAGYFWTFNDTRYQFVEFGRNRDYWKSRLRAGAFAWAYSEQMEIGPISEASIGNIQAEFPQWGFVDHVVTPAIGLGWMIAEDALDRYAVRYIESRTRNRYVRILVRGASNPSRSFANVLAGKLPWDRPRDHDPGLAYVQTRKATPAVSARPDRSTVSPFEFTANAYMYAASSGLCAGGGATAALRIAATWQVVLDVDGCKMAGLEKNLSGDSLIYMTGLRWTPKEFGPFVPFGQFLFGGNKLTQELMYPDKEQQLLAQAALDGQPLPNHSEYTHQFEADGFAIAGGLGVDLRFNRALAFRLMEVDYTRSWARNLVGFAAPNGAQLKLGLVVNTGKW
jgi:hypothetical protein